MGGGGEGRALCLVDSQNDSVQQLKRLTALQITG